MKKIASLILVSILGGAIALGSYMLFFDGQHQSIALNQNESFLPSTDENTTFVSHNFNRVSRGQLPNFTEAARKTVQAVVHVKNVQLRPENMYDYWRGIRNEPYIRGTGSGVIITPDGYIVTNYHVVKGASELRVTLYNKKTYKAKVVGVAEQQDIALLKIDAENLHYLPFGNSNNVKVGQWVLAVGNPFNLTSTVTAGIISAKGRNMREGGTRMESFLQTDAAINPGNSGGALVNLKGELIGINTAITSSTGSYIGYSFAIPSNNARKIVEDLMEYGNVKEARLGIKGYTIVPKHAEAMGIHISQGVHVVTSAYGAEKAGLRKGDLITQIDAVKVRKMADLAAYVRTKRPGDAVKVHFIRDGETHTVKVKLTEYKSYILKVANLEIANADADFLERFGVNHGVRIAGATSRNLKVPKDIIIVAIDGQPVSNVEEVKEIMENKERYGRTRITFQNSEGKRATFAF